MSEISKILKEADELLDGIKGANLSEEDREKLKEIAAQIKEWRKEQDLRKEKMKKMRIAREIIKFGFLLILVYLIGNFLMWLYVKDIVIFAGMCVILLGIVVGVAITFFVERKSKKWEGSVKEEG